jgi:PAS domain S-box-containing protein
MENQTPLSGQNMERRFQLLVASVTDYAIYMLDPSGRVSSWNPGAQRFTGYLSSEIIGQHFSVFYIEEERIAGVPDRALRTALEVGKFEAEGWRVRKDGTRFWADVVIDPIFDENHLFIGYAKITRDMSEQRMAQQELRASEERLRLLVQGVTDYAIYMLSPQGMVTNWNSGAERIKGYTSAEVVGTHFSRFYNDADRVAGIPEKALAIALDKGRYEQEGWRQRKDGSQFWAHVIIDAIHDSSGVLVGYAKVTRDITDRKQAEEALAQANAALFQSQKMEAIGQLTGGVAHDFNNLLGVLASSLDILGFRLFDPADRRLLDGMHRAIARGATLTQQLLSFARQQPLTVEPCNITQIIEGFETVPRRAGRSNIDFDLDLQTDLDAVSLDAARFESALLNLVVNARDSIVDGGRIGISTSNVTLHEKEVGLLPAGSYVRTVVQDTGTGMSEAVLKRAMEPFFTTKEVGKGTGLGLSQVYGFITQSGGDILIRSVVGVGTTVNIYLPANAAEKRVAASLVQIESVLIVEDEPDLLEVAKELFESMGYEVLTASNGKDALDIFSRRPDIDILFTDVMMPNGINGIELARQAKAQSPDLKIILVSGYTLPALKAQYGELDHFTFMNKPYRMAELAKELRTA